ncbi:uncharacterized protein PGTG_20730 [Puccinia graminis f. sp. tritici CRL 75-36-700-3]|uniref:Uncharacterized protein n=1 Tax=Puccinia graminis f. sp. tritici (strain CRL 75-36-700-3 / race SCCL) TaxID=418459 RepID=H6QP31_PUCGT|nr:uncharacterized protein PGTG_20730 [Puccinia graminis f. sp. tritici CRL 75-36-700-3]EHS63145.1 hypothetical protein PGTG_20730 [Puccinia graminis f. sp. tritici CRL 75-36-700-3]
MIHIPKRKNPSVDIGFIFADQIREMNKLYGAPEVRLDVYTTHRMGNRTGRLPVGGTLEHGEVIVPPTVLDDLITLWDPTMTLLELVPATPQIASSLSFIGTRGAWVEASGDIGTGCIVTANSKTIEDR